MTRPSKNEPQSIGFATQAVHLGNSGGQGSGAVRAPLVMANSYHLPEDPSTMGWSNTDQLVYTRNGGVNQRNLEEKLAALEGGEDAVVFATGVAALHAVFFTHLRSGDHIIVSDVTYEAVWRLFSELLTERYGVDATFVDVDDLHAVRAAIKPRTRIIHVETIANPTTKVADITALAHIAHEAGAILTVDSTFTPPPFYRPLEDGADIVIHSLTKYINGHGDAMGGAVIGSRDLLRHVRSDALVDLGGVISPFNAWMIVRGSVTLPLRLERHYRSAQAVADFLSGHPEIAFVSYPGLDSHPQHDLARRQFKGLGYGGVIAFALQGNSDRQNRFVNRLQIITSAVSLGHDESLIVHVGPTGRGGAENYPPAFRTFGHLRLSIGLESPEDLISDIWHAIEESSLG